MRIGVDLDGTFVDFSTPMLEETARRGFGEFEEKDIVAYRWTDWVPGFTKKDWEDVYFKTLLRRPHFFERLKPYSEEDMDYLRELCRVADVYVVSARDNAGKGLTSTTHQTAAWCRIHNLPVAGVYIANSHKKSEALKFLGCEFFIDDSPQTFVNCLENGINVWLYDRPWNRNIPTGKRLYTIKKFYEIVRGAMK
jgi:uncharacterized HAD superfamily protein